MKIMTSCFKARAQDRETKRTTARSYAVQNIVNIEAAKSLTNIEICKSIADQYKYGVNKHVCEASNT